MPLPPFFQSQPYISIHTVENPDGVKIGPGTDFPFVNGCQISQKGSQGDTPGQVTIQIGIDMPYAEGLKMMDGEYGAMFVGSKNIISVSLGYRDSSGMATNFYSGLMTSGGKGLSFGPDGLSGSINGTSDSASVRYMEAVTASFADKTLEQKLLYLTEAVGYLPEHTFISDEAKELLAASEEPSRSWFNGMATHQSRLHRIISNAGLFCNVGPGASLVPDAESVVVAPLQPPPGVMGISFFVLEEAMKAKPAIRFALRRKIDADTWPILAWNPGSDSIWLTNDPATAGMAASYIDRSGVLVTVATNPQQANIPQTNEEGGDDDSGESTEVASQPTDAQTDTGGSDPISSSESVVGDSSITTAGAIHRLRGRESLNSEAAQVELLNAVGYRDGRPIGGISASMTTIGCPLVTCGQVIEVAGVGAGLSGNYMVMECSHNWTGGSWETTLSLIDRRTESNAGTNAPTAS